MKVTISGNAVSTPNVMMSAKMKGQTPLKMSRTGMSGRTPFTTNTTSPTGGDNEAMPDSFTSTMPNQIGS